MKRLLDCTASDFEKITGKELNPLSYVKSPKSCHKNTYCEMGYNMVNLKYCEMYV